MKKKQKKTKKVAKQKIKFKTASKTQLVALIHELQGTVNDLLGRLDVAEANIANLLSQQAASNKKWPNWPYVNPWSPTWSPDGPTYCEVRTEVKRDAAK